jgi:hypothetical protein
VSSRCLSRPRPSSSHLSRKRHSGGGRNLGRQERPAVSPQRRNSGTIRPAFSGCMGLCVRFFNFPARPRCGEGRTIRRAEALDQPIRRSGAGGAQIADDRPDPGGPHPMLPRIAIAARRTAALAPVHPAPPAAVHRRRTAGEAGTGAGTAAGSAGEDGGLAGYVGWGVHIFASDRLWRGVALGRGLLSRKMRKL